MRSLDMPTKRKKAIDLTPDPDLVARACPMDGNLSALVERLLGEHIALEVRSAEARRREIEHNMAAWNAFAQTHGSFADEHSAL
ncbi:MAG: type II toxin-antitoxin system CcdA family antitoxin [Rhodocyclaceae bacterium]|nr:type II toxin-antitoxin system CcdA family antitoxin [Rhodocyclaceae bacterium]